MTDSFASSLIATATTAATNQLAVAANPSRGCLLTLWPDWRRGEPRPAKRCASARTEEETRNASFATREETVSTPLPPFLSLLELPPSRSPPLPPTPPQTCAFCECYSVKPSSVERFFCPMLVIHVCKKPRPFTWSPRRDTLIKLSGSGSHGQRIVSTWDERRKH